MNVHPTSPSHRMRLALVLWALLFLFVLRVLGQFFVALGLRGFLPPMTEWQSGLISYRALLASQFVIIILYGKVCLDLTRGTGFFSHARRRTGVWLLAFGALYFTSMVARYIVTMSLYPERRWTGGCIPVVFHLVLATFILLVGRDYYVRSQQAETLRISTEGESERCRPTTSISSLTAGVWRAQSARSRTS